MSLYTPDTNSSTAMEAMSAVKGERYLSLIGELEIVNAFHLRVFRKEISESQARSSLKNFESDLREGVFKLRELPDHIFERARQLSRQTTAKLGTRTADLLHVAAALEIGVDSLYTFDRLQRKLAQSVGLKLN